MITKVLKADIDEDIIEAGRILTEGGLVAIPTETVYGLAANALDSSAVIKIYIAKGRPSDNPLIVHISDFNQIYKLVKEIPDKAKRLAETYWPGPLTIILPKSEIIPYQTSGGMDTVAIRFPANITAQKVITAAGCPLAAPSANISGRPSPTSFMATYNDLNGRVDAIIDGGNCSVGVESTVISFCTDIPKLFRPGGITVKQIEKVIGKIEIDNAVLHKPASNAKILSPGMKYKHYSPKCDITIADMSFYDYRKLLDREPDYAAFCYEEDALSLNNKCVTFGKRYDSKSQAKELFKALNRLDELNYAKAYSRCPIKRDIGLAVYNRLIRSAGFKFIYPRQNIIGLTGTSGSGKTVVSEMLSKFGYKIIDCDKLTKSEKVYNKECLDELSKAFGNEVVSKGKLNRKVLARKAFQNGDNLRILEDITFPYITKEINNLIDNLSDVNDIILDAPTLFDSGLDERCRRVISVTSAQDIRIERIMKRDLITRNDAMERIVAQKNESFFSERCDYEIVNDSNEISLQNKVEALAEQMKKELIRS
jgi:L-threonylcarbamoyladenylate synthase